MTSLYYRAH